MTKQEWNKAIDNYIEEQNKKISKNFILDPAAPSSFPQAHTLITKDVIKNFAINIGDNNPLYTDEEYAKNTVWKGIIAPFGAFVRYIAETGTFARGNVVDGQTFLYGGTEYEFLDVIRPGDTFTLSDEFMGVKEKKLPPEKAEKYRLLTLQACRSYVNQHGIAAVKATGTVMITCVYKDPDAQPTTTAVYKAVEKPRYPQEMLDEIYSYYNDYLAGRYRRGNVPRYWDDVNVGDELDKLIKGPLDVTDMAAYSCAVGSIFGSGATKWESIRTLLTDKDPDTGAWITRDAFHFSDVYAHTTGMPAAMVYGAMEECFICESVANWMGDDGFVKKINIQNRRPLFHGDIFTVKGTVTDKYEKNGEYLVEITLSGENKDGTTVCPAKAVVRLPKR